jgi:hypothetical protein
MNSLDPNGPNNIANHIESLKGEILTRWRDELHRDAEQAAQIHQLDDEELEDHLPALTDMLFPIVGADASAEKIERDRNVIIDTIDRSMNVSISQYISPPRKNGILLKVRRGNFMNSAIGFLPHYPMSCAIKSRPFFSELNCSRI